jgi:dTDP-glucose pyrophosphorylase
VSQLYFIYDKPMLYYLLSILMLAGINEIAIITTPHYQENFKRLLGGKSVLELIKKRSQVKPSKDVYCN